VIPSTTSVATVSPTIPELSHAMLYKWLGCHLGSNPSSSIRIVLVPHVCVLCSVATRVQLCPSTSVSALMHDHHIDWRRMACRDEDLVQGSGWWRWVAHIMR
jgi:hypothetical protein